MKCWTFGVMLKVEIWEYYIVRYMGNGKKRNGFLADGLSIFLIMFFFFEKVKP